MTTLETRYRMWTERGGRIRLEPTQRRVRALLGGVTVADSKRVHLLYLPPPFNTYVFPRRDVRLDLCRESEAGTMPGLGETRQWSIETRQRLAENAAWTAADPPSGLEALADMLALRWNRMDTWYEEDDEVFVHPRDPYHRVDVLNSSRHVRVSLEGELLAETSRPRLLFETGLPVRYYIPRLDVRTELFEPSSSHTRCPYKGMAGYWSVRVGSTLHEDLAWSYEAPIPECPKIENLIAFYNERVDLEVDGEPVERPLTPWSRPPAPATKNL